MGQKIHPVGLRLGISQTHRSVWFAHPKQYAKTLQKDQKIRHVIAQIISQYRSNQLKYAGIARIQIHFNLDLVAIEIQTAYPSLLLEPYTLPTGITRVPFQCLRSEIQDLIGHQKLKIQYTHLTHPYRHALLIGEYIVCQLESRVAFRKAMKKGIELARCVKQGGVQGVKIQVSGRLNGAEIARVEWVREGRVPLHTLRAHIDYCHCPAQTIYGVLGIKVWVFQ